MDKLFLTGIFGAFVLIMLAGSVIADYDYGPVAKLNNETRESIANITNTRLGTNITPEKVGTGVVKEAIQAEKEDIKQEVVAYARNVSNMTQEEREAAKEAIREEAKNLVETRKEIGKEIREEVKLRLENKNITVKPLSDKEKEIIADKINARTGLNLSSEDIDNKTILRAYLSNGRYALVKVMPDTASERALERLRIRNCNESVNNCTLVLKEVGSGNETKAVYEVKARKKAKILGFIDTNMDVSTQVDAESGNVTSESRPWWSFLAREQDETPSSEANTTSNAAGTVPENTTTPENASSA